MAAEAEAAREARAKVIAAEGEQRASRALKEAAEVINESPAALQVLYIIYSLILSLSLLRQPTSSCSPCPLSSFPLSPGRYTCPLSPTLPLPCSPLSVLYCQRGNNNTHTGWRCYSGPTCHPPPSSCLLLCHILIQLCICRFVV